MDAHKKTKTTLLLIIASLALSGCNAQTDGKKVLRSGGETTVVIESTDSITPEKGAVYGVKRIQNFIAYDFLDEETTIGYKFSEAIFGDDRGVYVWNMNETAPLYRLALEKQPKQLKVSPDKTKLLYVPDQTGGVKAFSLLNIEDWKNDKAASPVSNQTESGEQLEAQPPTRSFMEQSFDLLRSDYLWAFNWFEGHEGGVVVPTGGNGYKLYTMDSEGNFANQAFELKVGESEYAYVLEQSLGRIDGTYVLAASGKRGGLFSLKGQKISPMGSEIQISQMSSSPKGNSIALSSFETDKTGQELWLYAPSGEKLTSLYKANFFTSLKWSDDGQKLAFSAVESDGRAALYLIDLKSNQLNFLGEYPGYGPNTIAFSPDHEKLLISYLNNEGLENDDPYWETQILTIVKDGGTYNE